MHIEKVQTYALIGLLTVVAVLCFFIFQPFLVPLALAYVFAVVLMPLYNRILRFMPNWRSSASIVTVIISSLLLIAPLALVSLLAIGEAEQQYVSLTQGGGLASGQEAIRSLGAALDPYVPGASSVAERTAASLNDYVRQGLSWLLGQVGTAFTGILSFVLKLFIFLLATYVFLKDGPRIRESVLRISPFKDTDDIRIFDRLALTVNAVVKGKLAVTVLQGISASIGFIIFGLPSPILWGMLTSIAGLVPALGTTLVVGPAVLFLFFTGHAANAIGLAIWGVVLVGLIDNVLGPYFVGRGIQMHQLTVMLAVLGGLAFFGAAGIFLGPLVVSLFVTLFGLYTAAVQAENAAS